MSDQNLDYAAIRRNVENSLSRQKWMYRFIFFGIHVLFYVAAMLAVWGTLASNSQLRAALFDNGSGAAVIVILPTILWTTLILCHVASLYTESSVGEKALRERLLVHEVGEDILRKGLVDVGVSEKPKRRAVVHEAGRFLLSDDGELIPADEDEPIGQSDYKARTNCTGDL